MIPFLLHIPPETPNHKALLWLFKTAVKALNLKHVVVRENPDANFESILLDANLLQTALTDPQFKIQELPNMTFEMNNEGIIIYKTQLDPLLTAFYLINSIQEHQGQYADVIGRFPYEKSYQHKYNCIMNNVVAKIFSNYFQENLPHPYRNVVQEKSSFFFSHDIDSLYGAFLQDGLAAMKNGRLDLVFKLVLNVVFLKPDWFNIDQILKIDNEYNLRSTFFWIVNKGRVSKTLTNADYSINAKAIKNTIKMVKDKGSHIGLHKSISNESFDEELAKLPFKTVINRNHYLRFSLPKHYEAIQASQIKIDCSLGFAEHQGFRNSLGIPFVPFDLQGQTPYGFLEVPLNIMDGTFQKYTQTPASEVSKKMINFIENNKHNSIISVLWHNHFFSSYRFRGFFEPYVELLEYLKENKYPAISPDQIYNKYYIE